MTYFVGVDIAKDLHFATILNHEGSVFKQAFSFKNTKDGFQSFLDSLPCLEDIVIGMESTAHYHMNLVNYLQDKGISTKVLNPLITKRFRGLSIRDVKNDKLDSLNIAVYLRFDNDTQYNPIRITNYLRSLCQEREKLKQLHTRSYIRLTAHLDKVFPEFKPYMKSLKTQGVHALLKKYSTAYEMKTARYDSLMNLLNIKRTVCSKDRALELKTLANNSIGFHDEAISFIIKQELDQIELFHKQLTEIDVRIVEYMKELNSPLLSIPGMGYIQAATIEATINNIARFDNPGKLLAYAGLDPKIRQSGKWEATSTRMSKRGNKLLRYTLIWSAHNLVKNSKTIEVYYKKKRSEGKSHYSALGHVSKKLVNYIYWVLTHPEEQFVLD